MEKANYRTVYMSPFILTLYVCVFIDALKLWKDVAIVNI